MPSGTLRTTLSQVSLERGGSSAWDTEETGMEGSRAPSRKWKGQSGVWKGASLTFQSSATRVSSRCSKPKTPSGIEQAQACSYCTFHEGQGRQTWWVKVRRDGRTEERDIRWDWRGANKVTGCFLLCLVQEEIIVLNLESLYSNRTLIVLLSYKVSFYRK